MSSASTVIVTGGSRGLGADIIEALLNLEYRIATCSRSKSDTISEFEHRFGPDRFLWLDTEIGIEDQEERFVNAVVDWSGPRSLLGLVNNAGIAGEGILATFPSIDIERIIRVNLLGSLRMSRLVARQLLSQGSGGRIINISSIIGQRGYTGLSAYSASKAGMDGMTRSLARELGRRQITVNSIAPGYLETEMSSTLSARQRDQIINRTPLKRLGTTDDIAPLVGFLLSDNARFITGQTIVVDGGITC